ncbi:MAG: preprotein translocase subunit SecE [Eubacteriaceae bacterium]|nr:preprotein translocase subunit SecE [Eubacteriaceae bacterium]
MSKSKTAGAKAKKSSNNKKSAGAKQSTATTTKQQAASKPVASTAKKPGIFKRIGNFITSSYDELKKVSWPTRKELFSHTWVVIIMCAFFSVVVFLFDSLFGRLIKLLM